MVTTTKAWKCALGAGHRVEKAGNSLVQKGQFLEGLNTIFFCSGAKANKTYKYIYPIVSKHQRVPRKALNNMDKLPALNVMLAYSFYR